MDARIRWENASSDMLCLCCPLPDEETLKWIGTDDGRTRRHNGRHAIQRMFLRPLRWSLLTLARRKRHCGSPNSTMTEASNISGSRSLPARRDYRVAEMSLVTPSTSLDCSRNCVETDLQHFGIAERDVRFIRLHLFEGLLHCFWLGASIASILSYGS